MGENTNDFQIDNYFGTEENTNDVIAKESMWSHLLYICYLDEEALTTIDICGWDTSLAELTYDAIPYPYSRSNDYLPKDKKRKLDCDEIWKIRT